MKKPDIPSIIAGRRPGWLSGNLSHKAFLTVVALAVLSCLLICRSYVFYLGAYADNVYGGVAAEADAIAREAADCLASHGGDYGALERYAASRGFSCEVRDAAGGLLFEYRPSPRESGFRISGSAEVSPGGGAELTVRTWSVPRKADDVGRSLRRRALAGLVVMIVCVFVVASILLYLLIFAPVASLRQTVRRYYEQGAAPQRSSRQDEIGRLQNTFVDMTGKLEEEKQAERRLVASISHDVKTPLTSVMGYSERLLSAELPGQKRRQYLRNIYDKALAIKSIVDEFDEYLEMGIHETLPMELVTMSEFCAAARREYQDELSDAGAAFTVECRCPDDRIRCNADRMRRFLGNLIGNSFQHAGSDHLELRLVCERRGDSVALSFSDNGRGVPPGLLGKIFQPFFTTDNGRKVSGLGLSICESIVRAHGGAISARNLPSGGLLVRAVLPRVSSDSRGAPGGGVPGKPERSGGKRSC